MVSPLATAAVLLIAVLLPGAAYADRIEVRTEPIPLSPANSAEHGVGNLVYRGGLVLSSTDKRFGGLSALMVGSNGGRMTAVTDRGHLFTAALVYDGSGWLADVTEGDITPLSHPDGSPVSGKMDSDAEALSVGPDGGVVVTFERRHRLWRYGKGFEAPAALPAPEGVGRLASNNGLEGLARTADGRLLAIAEGNRKDTAPGWLGGESGWSALTYAIEGGFRVAGAATLHGGDVLVLERKYRKGEVNATRIRRIKAATITAGARLKGEMLAEIAKPLNRDNFEGIDVRRLENGRTAVYIVSDNNFNPRQRTLMMMFELSE